jgi:putative FmdB family regulatory protein
MPIYEFDCEDCGDNFESLVFSYSKINGVTCPECKGSNIHKRVSTFAVKGDQGSGSSAAFSAGSSAACSTGGT